MARGKRGGGGHWPSVANITTSVSGRGGHHPGAKIGEVSKHGRMDPLRVLQERLRWVRHRRPPRGGGLDQH